jgi:hypothetical protein
MRTFHEPVVVRREGLKATVAVVCKMLKIAWFILRRDVALWGKVKEDGHIAVVCRFSRQSMGGRQPWSGSVSFMRVIEENFCCADFLVAVLLQIHTLNKLC